MLHPHRRHRRADTSSDLVQCHPLVHRPQTDLVMARRLGLLHAAANSQQHESDELSVERPHDVQNGTAHNNVGADGMAPAFGGDVK